MIIEVLQIMTSASLGILVGALLAEAKLLIPYWKMLDAKAFYDLHPIYAPRIYSFFAPITIAAPVLALGTVVAMFFYSDLINLWSVYACGLAWSLVAIYFMFFKDANQAFSDGKIAHGDMPNALDTWERWHWARIILGMLGFLSSLVAIA